MARDMKFNVQVTNFAPYFAASTLALKGGALTFADVELSGLQPHDETYHLNRVVLSAASSVLRSAFLSIDSSLEPTLLVPDFDETSRLGFISIMYTGTFQAPIEDCIELFKLLEVIGIDLESVHMLKELPPSMITVDSDGQPKPDVVMVVKRGTAGGGSGNIGGGSGRSGGGGGSVATDGALTPTAAAALDSSATSAHSADHSALDIQVINTVNKTPQQILTPASARPPRSKSLQQTPPNVTVTRRALLSPAPSAALMVAGGKTAGGASISAPYNVPTDDDDDEGNIECVNLDDDDSQQQQPEQRQQTAESADSIRRLPQNIDGGLGQMVYLEQEGAAVVVNGDNIDDFYPSVFSVVSQASAAPTFANQVTAGVVPTTAAAADASYVIGNDLYELPAQSQYVTAAAFETSDEAWGDGEQPVVYVSQNHPASAQIPVSTAADPLTVSTSEDDPLIPIHGGFENNYPTPIPSDTVMNIKRDPSQIRTDSDDTSSQQRQSYATRRSFRGGHLLADDERSTPESFQADDMPRSPPKKRRRGRPSKIHLEESTPGLSAQNDNTLNESNLNATPQQFNLLYNSHLQLESSLKRRPSMDTDLPTASVPPIKRRGRSSQRFDSEEQSHDEDYADNGFGDIYDDEAATDAISADDDKAALHSGEKLKRRMSEVQSKGSKSKVLLERLAENHDAAGTSSSDNVDQTVTCPCCNVLFADGPSLHQHVADEHPGETLFRCTICSYLTNKKKSIWMHTIRRHKQGGAFTPASHYTKRAISGPAKNKAFAAVKAESESQISGTESSTDEPRASHLKTPNKGRFSELKTMRPFSRKTKLSASDSEGGHQSEGTGNDNAHHSIDHENGDASMTALANVKAEPSAAETSDHLQSADAAESTFGENLQCKACAKQFRSAPYLRCHYEMKHLKMKNFRCLNCAYKSYARQTMDTHITRVHSDAKGDRLWAKIKSVEKVTKKSKRPVAAVKCGNKIGRPRKNGQVKGLVNGQANVVTGPWKKRCYQRMKNESSSICPYCSNSYYAGGMHRHIDQVHMRMTNYKCNVGDCNYKAYEKRDIIKHLSVHHQIAWTAEQADQLKLRSKRDDDSSQDPPPLRAADEVSSVGSVDRGEEPPTLVRDPLALMNSNETKPFFKKNKKKLRSTFGAQKKTKMAGKRPFSCPICPFKSARKGNLKNHVGIHERRGDVIPANGGGDDAASVSSAVSSVSSKAHQKLFSCTECEYTTRFNGNLRTHMVRHGATKKRTGRPLGSGRPKSFACTLCDRVFFLKENLTRHMKTHDCDDVDRLFSDEKPKCAATIAGKLLVEEKPSKSGETSSNLTNGGVGLLLTVKRDENATPQFVSEDSASDADVDRSINALTKQVAVGLAAATASSSGAENVDSEDDAGLQKSSIAPNEIVSGGGGGESTDVGLLHKSTPLQNIGDGESAAVADIDTTSNTGFVHSEIHTGEKPGDGNTNVANIDTTSDSGIIHDAIHTGEKPSFVDAALTVAKINTTTSDLGVTHDGTHTGEKHWSVDAAQVEKPQDGVVSLQDDEHMGEKHLLVDVVNAHGEKPQEGAEFAESMAVRGKGTLCISPDGISVGNLE